MIGLLGGTDKRQLEDEQGTQDARCGTTFDFVGATMTDAANDRDVVDILTSDHLEVMSLVHHIKDTPSSEAARRRDLADTLIAELVRHAVAEEMYVYPAMRDNLPNGAEAVEHDTQEHKELERTMKALRVRTPTIRASLRS